MEKTKLISVRVPESIVDAIDRACDSYSCYKRSDYINAALSLIVEVKKRGLFHDFIRFHPDLGDVVDELSFKYHREKL